MNREKERAPAVMCTLGSDCYHLSESVNVGLGEQGGHTAASPVCFGRGMKTPSDPMGLTNMNGDAFSRTLVCGSHRANY